jgi:hypothetical protein
MIFKDTEHGVTCSRFHKRMNYYSNLYKDTISTNTDDTIIFLNIQ